MSHKKIVLLLLLTVLSMGAGLELGWVWSKYGPAAHGAPPRPWFDQLELNADQQKQMDKIWNDARQQMHELFEHRHDLDKQRDQEMRALLTPAQSASFDKIEQEYRASRAQLDKQRDSLLSDANGRSRALLDPAQVQKWDILAKDMQNRRWRGPMGMATQRSTTMPSADSPVHQNAGPS